MVKKPLAAWNPQPGPQLAAIEADWCDELFYGGARFGGKSDFLLGDFLQDVETYGEHWQGVLFRESLVELENIIHRAHSIYPQTGAEWKEQKKEYRWPNGAILRFRYFDKESDITSYQGHSYTWIGIDELGNWASETSYKLIRTCLRWARADIPTKRIRCTGNPGGIGQHWIFGYFISYAPLGHKPFRDEVTGSTRMFIPSKVSDNKIGLANDPGYVGRLKDLGSPTLVKAWLEGDWTAMVGAYFPEFSIDRHVVRPVYLPKQWLRFAAFDWGSAAPFVMVWFAVSDGSGVTQPDGTEVFFPSGSLIVYREVYGAKGPNKGLGLSAEEAADYVLERTNRDEEVTYMVCDPSMFRQDGGESIAERMERRGLRFERADNTREAGWDAIRSRLRGQDGKPMLYFFSTCTETIRTLPALQHDGRNPEDVDTRGDDHCGDAVRYGCMSRPYVRPQVVKEKPRFIGEATLNELWEAEGKQRRRERMFDYRV